MKIINFYLIVTAFIAASALPSYCQSDARVLLAYTGGQHAPIGVTLGMITNKGGFMVNTRWSSTAFGETSIYSMTDADGMDDDFWTWSYTGNYQYRRASVTVAYISNLSGDIAGTSLHGYVGLGWGFANYMYEYEQIGSSGTNYGTEWIKYNDISISSIEAEGGLIMDFNGFNVGIGYSTLDFMETMFTFSIGASF